jgi:hypothetical protein
MTGQDIGIVLGALNTLIITLAAIFAKRADAKASRAIVVAAQGVEVSQRNAGLLEIVKTQTDGITKELGKAKLAQGTAEGKAVGLQQGRDEANGK